LEEIDIWGEMFLTTPRSEGAEQLLRGHPTSDRHGEMFDWVAVTFDTDDPSEDGIVGPAKILAFFKDMDGVDRAVVHATNVTTGRETKAGNSLLIQNVRLEVTQRGHPALRIIRVNQIDHGIMAFEHENFVGPLPSPTNLSVDKSKCVASCFTDRDHWAFLFHEWAKNLPVKDMRTGPEADEDADTDLDDVSDSDNASMQRRASNR
jgi:hypothetical protein